MDTTERKLLNLVQADFPLAAQPFAEIGLKLGISEGEVIQRLQDLKDSGIVRWIGAIVDARKLGYSSTLVAMRVLPAHLDDVAAVVSQHPGVSHNYARSHDYNLWFTLAIPPTESLHDVLVKLSNQPGVQAAVSLPALRLFKINVFFNMTGGNGLKSSHGHRHKSSTGVSSVAVVTLSDEEESILRQLQADLPLQPRPFDRVAQQIGIGVDAFLNGAKRLQTRGVMRRYSASLQHRRVGFIANAMTCWMVPASEVERVGTEIASYPAVSHCYERQVDGDWKYNLFAMIHGRNQSECETVAANISQEAGIGQPISLYSTKEYKKERVRFLG